MKPRDLIHDFYRPEPKSKRDKKHYVYFGSAVDDLRLSLKAVRLLVHLERRISRRTGFARCSIRSMAKTCCMTNNTLCRAIEELEARGIIEVKRNHRSSSVYRFKHYSEWRKPADIIPFPPFSNPS